MTGIAALADRKLQVADLYALARCDFGTFVELAFRILHPGKTLVHASYLDLLVAVMESCAAGRYPRVIVNLPPGYMKSILISIMYVAWRLGVDPTLKFVCISYGDDLAHKPSAATRKLMQSPEYRAIFPGTVLDKKAEDWLTTTKGGYRYATAVGSDITGFRPTEIVDIKFGAYSLRGQCQERVYPGHAPRRTRRSRWYAASTGRLLYLVTAARG